MIYQKTPIPSSSYSTISEIIDSLLSQDPYERHTRQHPSPTVTSENAMDFDKQEPAQGVPNYVPGINQPILSPEYQAGAVIKRRYDPSFIPPPLYPEMAQYELESTYFYDLVDEIALQNQSIRKCNHDLGIARRLLAARLAERLYPVLMAIPEELVRQETIYVYIANHLHDVYTTQDTQLHTLVNNHFNAMVRKGLPAGLAARDVHI